MVPFRRKPLFALLGGAFLSLSAAHAQVAPLDAVVVTAERDDAPLTVTTDPRKPRQPLPAHDGADFLKTIPGFSVIRKGGTDGDPVLRGMAGSRLGILVDGEHLLGGCGGRMDPPTAYVFPEAFDRVTVIKGPQGVLNGPGQSAGVVLFERDPKRFTAPGARAYASLLGGSFGRHDEVVDAQAGSPDFQAQGVATRSHSNDYADGKGERVHSRYTRWSANASLAWTPDERTRVELTGARSDGEAAYADRMMDGTKFKRTNAGLRFRKDGLTPLVERFEAHAFRNYVDHVMDNFSLRDLATGSMPAVSNPDRETRGAKVLAHLKPNDTNRIVVGADWQANDHTVRSTMNETAMPYESMARAEDGTFSNRGVFGEWTHEHPGAGRLVAGLRLDRWRTQDQRATIRLGKGPMSVAAVNPTAGETRSDTLASGFARVEREWGGKATTVYAGLGTVERFPDYWELFSDREGPSSISGFGTRPERTTQIDAGLLHRAGDWHATVSAFAGRIDDYILIESGVARTMPVRAATIARNVDAKTRGLEAGFGRAFASHWKADATLAWVRGENDTDGTPLAQQPPLEARLSLTREDPRWSMGALLRAVARQDRVDPGKGNIAGQDIGPSAGFAIFSLNAGARLSKSVQLTGGVDNLFDRSYAEHLSRSGAMVPGFLQTTRVNEPGRTIWVKLQFSL
ncbi:MAG TPA: TonB-dependent copper receptor [Usitatibacteraceae bacterium]|nr:TonB-dependent copper receptor [Usitatibacteraceae bacterium]